MAASINDYFNLVNNGALAEPAQLAANKQTTDTTASLTLATGWPTATAVHLALFKTNTDGTVDDSTVTYWKATLAGTTLSDMTLKGGTNQAYATGDSAVILSPYQFNDMVEGILKEHNQDGTHKDITTDNLTVSSNVTLPTGSVTPVMRSGGFKIGVIPGSTLGSTGNKSITGVGFRPKLIKLSMMPPNSSGNVLFGFGAATESDQYVVAGTASTSATRRHSSTSHCIAYMGTAETPSLLASRVSLDEDGFTLNVSIASSTFDVAYEAYA